MQASELQAVVETFDTYPSWQAAQTQVEDLRSEMPARNEHNPVWLRAQAELVEAQQGIGGARQALQIEVAQAKDTLPLPFRLGLLGALQKQLGLTPPHPACRLLTIANSHGIMHDSPDVKRSDWVYSPSSPFTYAALFGNAVQEVEAALPRFAAKVPLAVLGAYQAPGRHLYTAQTRASFYWMDKPNDRKLSSEPEITLNRDGEPTVSFTIPRLAVTKATYDSQRGVILPSASDTKSQTIAIPKIDMLNSPDTDISPKKLIIGKRAVHAFAHKHAGDIAKSKKEQRRRDKADAENAGRVYG